ncbi:hypothetical protein PoB_003223300 [Plakobranchus ocellatus]|uniref:Uncharacterized protein n=1 Tax=Plakobranchus ocellatus TaxID=259542 RepID=A0AAV4AGQ7_9GAST|nr:hypothetical protein PoB_003223300 [Plakobranchus ocellatus]
MPPQYSQPTMPARRTGALNRHHLGRASHPQQDHRHTGSFERPPTREYPPQNLQQEQNRMRHRFDDEDGPVDESIERMPYRQPSDTNPSQQRRQAE